MRALLCLPLLAIVACDDPPPPPKAPVLPPAPTALPAATSRYPAAPNNGLVYDLFGMKVSDPYRPLEELDAPATRAWIDAENKLTDDALKNAPTLGEFRASLTKLTELEASQPPRLKGGKWFWQYDNGKDAQPSIVMATTETGAPKTVLDPNALSPDGKESLAAWDVSADGSRLVYGLAAGGGDWTTWHVRDLATGKDLPDALPNSKYYTPQITKDGKGIYYGRFPTPTPGKELSEADHDHKVYFHVVGTSITQDKVIYERPQTPSVQYAPILTEDERYLVIQTGDGEVGDRNLEEIVAIDLKNPTAKPVIIGEGFTGDNWLTGNDGTRFFVLTRQGAPNGRLVSVDLSAPKVWKDVIPESKQPIESVAYVGRQLIVTYLQDAHSGITVFDEAGKKLRDVALPGSGSAAVRDGLKSARSTYLSFETFTTPRTVYRYDLDSGKLTPFHAPKLAHDPNAFDTTQSFYGNAKVPITVVTPKGAPKDGSRALLLTGYGFGGVPYMPRFRASTIAWLQHGGSFAVANIRGGGEYGDAWRLAAYREKKQVTYDDFEDAARWLASEKYTTAAKLGIFGASGGGHLVGVAETQHPELFGAVAPYVGVHDMLRFHLFGEGAGWSEDWGSPTVEKEAKALLSTSPLHNVKPGTRYPATYIVTGDHDVRVAPLHSYKFAAAMQAAQAGPAPILLRVETSAGHGGATTRSARVDNDAEELAFFARYLEKAD